MPAEDYPGYYGQGNENEARPLVRARTMVSDRSELSEDTLTGEQGSVGVPNQTERRVAHPSGRPRP